MDDHDSLIDTYIAAWNEADPVRRRALIARALTPDAAYCDPMMESAGHAGLDAMLQAVQARFPGHRFRRGGPVEAHHDRLRFTWTLLAPGGPEDGAALAAGTDVAVVAPDGRLRCVTGFLDQTPAAA